MVDDLYPGANGSNPGNYGTAMATSGTTLYFSAITPNGREVWQADDTSVSRVKFITTEMDTYAAAGLNIAAGNLYFSADGGDGKEQ